MQIIGVKHGSGVFNGNPWSKYFIYTVSDFNDKELQKAKGKKTEILQVKEDYFKNILEHYKTTYDKLVGLNVKDIDWDRNNNIKFIHLG